MPHYPAPRNVSVTCCICLSSCAAPLCCCWERGAQQHCACSHQPCGFPSMCEAPAAGMGLGHPPPPGAPSLPAQVPLGGKWQRWCWANTIPTPASCSVPAGRQQQHRNKPPPQGDRASLPPRAALEPQPPMDYTTTMLFQLLLLVVLPIRHPQGKKPKQLASQCQAEMGVLQ